MTIVGRFVCKLCGVDDWVDRSSYYKLMNSCTSTDCPSTFRTAPKGCLMVEDHEHIGKT